jgi:hypothetical protein
MELVAYFATTGFIGGTFRFGTYHSMVTSSAYHKPSEEELDVDGDGKKYHRDGNSF